ncbi:MAG TPA: hypothetical protein VI603_11415 [Saprospiraceae bacterium]|nr:hypothetical protein [Saprospiraceae bacterium]
MRNTSTTGVKETTIYRILGDGHAHILEYVLRDPFTLTLLAMVLVTNLMIILIPVSAHLFDIGFATQFWYLFALSLLLPGYAALISMLISRCKRPTVLSQNLTRIDKGPLRSKTDLGDRLISTGEKPFDDTLSQVPRLRNIIIGIQCLLFASLLCSTFIMREQMHLLKHTGPGYHTELVVLNGNSPNPSGTSLLPFLRQCISL